MKPLACRNPITPEIRQPCILKFFVLIRQNVFAFGLLCAAGLALDVSRAAAVNILFYGNSFTNGLLSTDSVPNLVREIATAAGQTTPTVVNAAVNGQSFSWHLANNTSVITTGLPDDEQWNYAVLQNFSTAPTHVGNLAGHRTDSVALYQAIANHSPNYTPVLFETWARGPGHSFYSGSSPSFSGGAAQMQSEVRTGYELAAQDIDAVAGAGTTRIATVGDAWEAAHWSNLHGSDIYHGQNRGTLLAALEIYSTVYQDNTSDIDLTGVLSGLGLTANDGLVLTSVVDGIALPSPPKDVTLKFDFGAGYHAGARYNVVPAESQAVSDAIDFDTGLPSGINLSITSPTGFDEIVTNTNGTASPGAPANNFIDGNASRNNLFGHDSTIFTGSPRELVEVTIAGLEQNRQYDFTFFASRQGVSDNRDTQYEVAGLTSGVDTLNASNNTSDVAQVLGIQPTLAGEIVLTIEEGPDNTNSNGFFYLGGLEISSAGVVDTADFDSDEDVDGADFLTWQRGVAADLNPALAQGNSNGDGVVDGADLDIWKTQFGTPSGVVASSSAPEPAGLTLFAIAAVLLACRPRIKASKTCR